MAGRGLASVGGLGLAEGEAESEDQLLVYKIREGWEEGGRSQVCLQRMVRLV